MFISMQGPWSVTVKSNEGGNPRRFVITGTGTVADGNHSSAAGTTVNVNVAPSHAWSLGIQADTGTGFIASDTQIKFPTKVLGNYKFDIESNDAGSGPDPVLDDLILTCSTPATINDFIIYGHVSLYGNCIFNPCWLRPYLIDTYAGLVAAMKNPVLSKVIQKLYPERVIGWINPNPPDPAPDYFKPMVIDLFDDMMQPKIAQVYAISDATAKTDTRSKAAAAAATADSQAGNFRVLKTIQTSQSTNATSILSSSFDKVAIARAIDGLRFPCVTENGANLTLTFEEYDRTASELAGGAYTGDGNRGALGNAVTDMNGNYIFRFHFGMTFPNLEDAGDVAAGESVVTALLPDVIVKEVSFSPYQVNYESAPYWNIPNLKRIDICMPESAVQTTNSCFNGNLIGQLGNVFIGGNQNSSDVINAAHLTRSGFSNYLAPDGKISVNSSLAGFSIECASWGGMVDVKGCMYDVSKSFAQNNIHWYTLKIRRSGTANWNFVNESYLHPKFHNKNVPNYIGDPVGPFFPNVGGHLTGNTPAYINIQREVYIGNANMDWDFDSIDRYMQLHTDLYDVVSGVRTPGTFYLQVDGYDGPGNIVSSDLIALYIHNLDLGFQLSGPTITDAGVASSGCGLYHLTDAQMKTPVQLQFKANDPYGFVNDYALTMSRCPSPMIALHVIDPAAIADTAAGATTLKAGTKPSNVHTACPGYTGTIADFSTNGLVTVDIVPAAAEDGWLKAAESFAVYGFALTANKRVTNGYNTGLSSTYQAYGQVMMERA